MGFADDRIVAGLLVAPAECAHVEEGFQGRTASRCTALRSSWMTPAVRSSRICHTSTWAVRIRGSLDHTHGG
jgi:hypothetical protein